LCRTHADFQQCPSTEFASIDIEIFSGDWRSGQPDTTKIPKLTRVEVDVSEFPKRSRRRMEGRHSFIPKPVRQAEAPCRGKIEWEDRSAVQQTDPEIGLPRAEGNRVEKADTILAAYVSVIATGNCCANAPLVCPDDTPGPAARTGRIRDCGSLFGRDR